MRIALVSSSSGSRGGGEFYLCGLARGLSNLGHEIHSVISDHSRMDELSLSLSEFGPVHRWKYQNTYDRKLRSIGAVMAFREIRTLRHMLSRLPVDVIHLNKQNLEDGLDLLAAAEGSNLPSVTTIHVTRSMRNLKSAAAGLRDFVSRWTLRRSKSPLIAIANAGVDDLARIDIPKGRLNLVWNGVGSASQEDRAMIRSKWGCIEGDFVLGCVARIESQKNPLFLLPLLAQLPQHVKLVWIGDGSLRETMLQHARDLGISDRVVSPGWQHNAGKLMPGFDLFVLPSIYEGFPFAILEAMAAGLPCLASDVDGVAEAVIDSKTGYVCPTNDSSVWLKRLRECVDDPARMTAFGRAGHSRYLEHFSLEAMAQKTLCVYENAIKSFGAN